MRLPFWAWYRAGEYARHRLAQRSLMQVVWGRFGVKLRLLLVALMFSCRGGSLFSELSAPELPA
jgi:hypothetical protein